MKNRVFVLLLWLIGIFSVLASPPKKNPDFKGPFYIKSLKASIRKIDVRKLRQIPPGKFPGFRRKRRPIPEMERKFHFIKARDFDPVVQTTIKKMAMPAPIISFDGLDLNNWGAGWPPDTNGDVGKTNVEDGGTLKGYYIQTVNTSIGIFDKSTGALVAAFTFDDFFDGTGTACDNNNYGDPVVLYDRYLDRWIITDFAFADAYSAPHYECIAMSMSNDPVKGGWYQWGIQIESDPSSENLLNDYPKMGVWWDAYYMTFNMFDMNSSTFTGVRVYALDKNSMKTGTLNFVYFDLPYSNDARNWSMLPANAKSPTAPPTGSPNYLVSMADDAWSDNPDGQDELLLWKFYVDWTTPSNSHIDGPIKIPTAPFDSNMCGGSRDCIPQKETSQKLDSISDRLMHSAFYWNFGGEEAIVVNHTVDANGSDLAGVRWYELRDPGGTPTIHQQGTYSPDSNHRWMGSTAIDSNGNIAIGFSISSTDKYPSIYFAGHKNGDPLGEMTQGEASIIDGSGSQTGYNRWGDYSMLTIDPDDDLTFWYTTEYYPSTGTDWHTRIGTFKFAPPGDNPPSISITYPNNGDTISGTITVTVNATDDNGIDRVEYYVDGNLKYTATTSPYSWDWDTTSIFDGTHSLKAVAYDTVNQTSYDEISITTNNGVQGMLVVDLDTNNNSCVYIRDELQNAGYAVQYETSMPSSISSSSYIATWVCLGIYSNNHVLDDTESQVLANYLDAGGRVYMEGGDTWCYDPSTTVHSYFGTWLNGDSNCSDGSGDLATINGETGTFTEGLSFSYGGENNYIDHIGANQSDSFNIWSNSSPSYFCGVARDNSTAGYRTIASSFEFGGIPSSERASIMQKYIDFFISGVVDNPPTVSITNPSDGATVSSTVNVTTSATDDHSVTKVEFYLDGALQYTYTCSGGTTCDANWSWDTTSSSDGAHQIKAVAYDNASTPQTGEDIINVTVDNASVTPSTWTVFLGGADRDIGKALAVHGSYLVAAGRSFSNSYGDSDVMVYKLNTADGSEVWEKHYGGGAEDAAMSVVLDSNENMYLAGRTRTNSYGERDILVYALDGSGAELWHKNYGGASDEASRAVAINGTKIYVAGFSKTGTASGRFDLKLYSINTTNGSVGWESLYGGDEPDKAHGVAVDPVSGDLIVVGFTKSITYGGKDIAVYRVSGSDGSVVWSAHYGGAADDVSHWVTVSGNYIYLVGDSQSTGYGGWDIVVYKLNLSDGSKVWNATFASSVDERAYGVKMDKDGNLLVIGYTDNSSFGGSDILLIKINPSDGSEIWSKLYGGDGNERGYGIDVDSNNYYYLIGKSRSSGTHGLMDFFITKVKDDGTLAPTAAFQSAPANLTTSVNH